MKTEFLTGLGLSKEVVDKVMEENGKDVNAAKDAQKAAETERDNLKGQLEISQAAAKGFAGKTPEQVAAAEAEMNQKLADMQAKYDKTITDHQKEIAKRDFDGLISTEIAAAKGKNAKAIMANLDLEKLQGSKNQKEDVAAALAALQKSDAYLFGDAQSTRQVISTGGVHEEDGGGAPSDSNAQMNNMIRGKLKGE